MPLKWLKKRNNVWLERVLVSNKMKSKPAICHDYLCYSKICDKYNMLHPYSSNLSTLILENVMWENEESS